MNAKNLDNDAVRNNDSPSGLTSEPDFPPAPSTAPAPGVTPEPGQARPRAQIREAALLALETKRARLVALKEEASNLAKELAISEQGLMEALATGASAPTGWALGVEETTRKSPSWKTEALALAIAAGVDPKEFEAQVQERTKVSVSRSLVVTKLGR